MTTEEEICKLCRIDGTVLLSSHQFSDKYYNLKDLYCRKRKLVLDYFIEKIGNLDFDCIASMELGGAIIASGLAERLNKSLAILRKERPSLGRPHGKVLIIDDVSTTGNSLNQIRKWCLDCNTEIVKEVVGIERMALEFVIS